MIKKSKTIVRTIDNNDWLIDANSKNSVWVYGKNTEKTLSFTTKATEGYGKIGTVYVKNGNNLDIITKYLNLEKGNIKTIKNIVKNYYTTQDAGEITIDSNPVAITDTYKIINGNYTSNSSDTPEYIYASKGEYNLIGNGKWGAEIYEEKGNNTYNINNILEDGVNAFYEFKGNDIYNFASSTPSANLVFDFQGSDNYFSKENTKLDITDYKGNDKYNIKNSNIMSFDYSGKDYYEITNSSAAYLYDAKGNDKYQILNSNAPNQTIFDIQGKDNYNIINSSNLVVNESVVEKNNKSGNDFYNVTASSSIEINEASEFSGNDKYNFTSVNNSALSSTDEILDASGNDKYNIIASGDINFTDLSGADNWNVTLSDNIDIVKDRGNDRYKINNSDNTTITDNKGSDNYEVLSNSINTTLVDKSGKDVYSISNSFDLTIKDLAQSLDKYIFNNVNNADITDNGGKDTYKVSDSSNITIQNNTTLIMSDKKQDTNTFNISNSTFEIYTNKLNQNTDNNFISKENYNINSSSGLIEDYDMASDTYKINKLDGAVKILDFGGNKDSLIISNAKTSNLVFMAGGIWNDDFSLINPDNSLYIYDKENKGFTVINSYFKSTDNEFTDFGNGKIETLKAGKKEFSNLISIDKLNDIQSSVSGWLKTNNYFSVNDVLDSSEQTDINSLIAVFSENAIV